MIKLRFSKPLYKTYDAGRVTTCTYECTRVGPKDENDAEHLRFTVTGKAVCSKQDVPDERIGRHIAESRAKLLAYKKVSYNPITIRFYENVIDNLAELVMFQYKISRCRKREIDHLRDLTK